jgi:hypothetical protein
MILDYQKYNEFVIILKYVKKQLNIGNFNKHLKLFRINYK